MAAIEENRTNARRSASRVSSSRYAAPAAFAPVTAASSARLVSASIVLWATPAVCMTAPSGGPPAAIRSSSPATWSRSAVSQAITSAPTP